MSDPPDITVVVPLHNEAESLERLTKELVAALDQLDMRSEVVFVDDGSTDDTAARLTEIARQRPGLIVPVRLSRNFGKENALAAGLTAARGRAVIVMDGDLQHPPALIPQLVSRWQSGADVVNAVKADRGKEGVFHRLFARAFYALIGGAIGQRMESQSDFKLLDRQVVENILTFPEQHRFFRGLVAWVGFRVDEVPFQVQGRAAGRPSLTGLRLVGYAVRNLMAFSSLPLRAIAWFGFITTALAAILAVQTLYNWAAGRAISGFTTAILVTLIIGGVNLVCLGIVAVYLSVMYDELKRRPAFIVRKDRGESADLR
jgi:glycosyltransferase involved in cell wall biosynthesis